jgi:hypothetical protein
MKKISMKIEAVAKNHFKGHKILVDHKSNEESAYRLIISNKLNVTGIIIYSKFIKRMIRENFTIFERLYYREKLQDTAIMVIMSTIYNLMNSKDCIETLVDLWKKEVSTGAQYEKKEQEILLLSRRLSEEIVPFHNRNKFIIQPNIKINMKLSRIFSTVILRNIMDFIGYRG